MHMYVNLFGFGSWEDDDFDALVDMLDEEPLTRDRFRVLATTTSNMWWSAKYEDTYEKTPAEMAGQMVPTPADLGALFDVFADASPSDMDPALELTRQQFREGHAALNKAIDKAVPTAAAWQDMFMTRRELWRIVAPLRAAARRPRAMGGEGGGSGDKAAADRGEGESEADVGAEAVASSRPRGGGSGRTMAEITRRLEAVLWALPAEFPTSIDEVVGEYVRDAADALAAAVRAGWAGPEGSEMPPRRHGTSLPLPQLAAMTAAVLAAAPRNLAVDNMTTASARAQYHAELDAVLQQCLAATEGAPGGGSGNCDSARRGAQALIEAYFEERKDATLCARALFAAAAPQLRAAATRTPPRGDGWLGQSPQPAQDGHAWQWVTRTRRSSARAPLDDKPACWCGGDGERPCQQLLQGGACLEVVLAQVSVSQPASGPCLRCPNCGADREPRVEADTAARARRRSANPTVGCSWGAGVDNLQARLDYLEFEARLEVEKEAHARRGGRGLAPPQAADHDGRQQGCERCRLTRFDHPPLGDSGAVDY